MPKRTRTPQRQTVSSNTYRFFVDAGAFDGRSVQIDDAELAHQIGTVLRLRAGERVTLLDNCGWQYTVAIEQAERGRVAGVVERKELAGGEPRTKIALYVALMRPERFEWVLQKGTELGVSAFVPLICERSTIADADALSEHKLDRWRRIIREAAEQSRRGKLPRLAPAGMLPAACDQAAKRGTALLLWEGAGGVPSLRQALHHARQGHTPPEQLEGHSDANRGMPFSVALFSGPEGGFSTSEFETAVRYGMIAVTLGPRTLRAETAPIAASAAILYEMGDLE
ncbi:MAG: 16S rRNA (uracil(1498)-N(3))-methyltransferase [Kouleothrix sp.]|jgi:16S rRNA (uracil1498-N3)-methyltransferase|nr:16S rRNA (uracil(1498)-N(3))-methyltransferase [Kouleothrix sp.]